MRRHLLVVSEKKIKMLETTLPKQKVKYYRWRHNNFLRTTYIHNKYMYTIKAYYLEYCGTYAPYRRRRTPDAGHRTMDAGRWTLDAGS